MVKVIPIQGNKELKKFVRFKNNLYRGNPYAVPTLEEDELFTLSTKNPAADFCQWQCFLAYNEQDKIVGRICAFINSRANETWNKNAGRFGFFDFIEDIEVARALLDAAENWLRDRKVDEMQGPLGFTDMDEEGMLVEGYEELGTMATLYNHPYYPQFIEQLGYVKDADWVEILIKIPDEIPERVVKFAHIVEKKNNLHLVKVKNGTQLIREGWGTKIFELINSEYAKLYGFTPMTQRQIDHYIKMYLPIVRLELICLIADEADNLVGFGISLPSLSRALQKSKGRMFPLGWFHMLRALKGRHADIVDLMLIAVAVDYQNKGLTAILMHEIIKGMQKVGALYAESNPELESNETMQNQWEMFERRVHKRRRAYIKKID